MKTNRSERLRIGAIEVVKVVREFHELEAAEPEEFVFGETVGMRIDAHLRTAAEAGNEVQSVTLHLDSDAWGQVINSLLQGNAA
jgi:hypothetical protein